LNFPLHTTKLSAKYLTFSPTQFKSFGANDIECLHSSKFSKQFTTPETTSQKRVMKKIENNRC